MFYESPSRGSVNSFTVIIEENISIFSILITLEFYEYSIEIQRTRRED